MPFRFPHRTPVKVGRGLPRINVNSVGYAKHFPRPWSDEYYSGQIGDGYSRHLPGRDSDISQLQWSTGLFGGINSTYPSEFGRGLNTFLNGYTRHISRHDDDDDADTRHGNGYTRHLSVSDVPLRPGPFGGITARFRSEFGHSQSSLLSGGHGFLTSSVDSVNIETNQ